MTTTLNAPGTAPSGVESQTWNVDPSHTAVTFAVKHFFTPVKGRFDEVSAELSYDRERPENSSVRVRIPVASINTGNQRRDGHLLSADFFEGDSHPAITFESEEVEVRSEAELLVRGPLTIKGISRTVEIPVKVMGVTQLPEELQQAFGGIREVASFEAELSVDRRDFGVGVGSWAATAVVGGKVDIQLSVEANR